MQFVAYDATEQMTEPEARHNPYRAALTCVPSSPGTSGFTRLVVEARSLGALSSTSSLRFARKGYWVWMMRLRFPHFCVVPHRPPRSTTRPRIAGVSRTSDTACTR